MKKTVDVSIPLGPMHPVWKEPCRLKCETIGERVLRAEMELGYMKKGIEKIMRGRPWQEVMFLAERVCGICSVIHNMVFIEAMEKLSEIAVPDRAAYLRVMVNELDRIASHLLANFSYCYTIEHETLGMYLLNIRETAMDLLEKTTGARVTCSYIVPGGVRFDLPDAEKDEILIALVKIESETRRYMDMFDQGPLIALRSKGVGTLTREHALEAHAVGPTARASGIDVDIRSQHPTYQRLKFSPIVRTEGDNHARIMIRFEEVMQSVAIIRTIINTLPEGPIRGGGTMKKGSIIYAGEAPRGELSYRLKADSYGRIQEIYIQTPSIMNIEACVHHMIPGSESMADVTATYISADPCISCTER
ncbi:MAG TPA: nickel-dependent hydrogenase large subunit [Methanospirillum sp.]|nr:nickel-dependent hydrogenase large subunit [Methanospirillum sp.]